MLSPASQLIGQTLRQLEFSSRFDLNVLAIRHRGEQLTTNLNDQPLDFGDTLLVAGGWMRSDACAVIAKTLSC